MFSWFTHLNDTITNPGGMHNVNRNNFFKCVYSHDYLKTPQRCPYNPQLDTTVCINNEMLIITEVLPYMLQFKHVV